MCMYGSYYDGGKPSKEYKEMIKAAEIQNKTERQRRRIAKKVVLSIEGLPGDLSEWVDTIFEKVMFYKKIKRGKYTARCEACQSTVELNHARSSRRIQCPCCGSQVILRDASKFPSSYHQRQCFAIVDKVLDGWTQRIFVCYRSTSFNLSEVYSTNHIEENQRDYLDGKGDVWSFHPIPYYEWETTKRWESGMGRVHGQGWNGWVAAAMPLHSYPNNLNELFRGSEYQYSEIEIASKHILVNPLRYVAKYGKDHDMEMVLKVGLYGVAREIIRESYFYGGTREALKAAKSIKDFGINSKEEAKECSELGVGLLFARKEVKSWDIEECVRTQAWQFVKKINDICDTDFRYSFISRERWFKYYLTQTSDYKEVGNFINDYRDYISDCIKLGMNLKDTAVNRPKSLKVSHDWARDEIKIQETQVYDALIEATHDSLARLVEWSDGKFTVIMPRTSREIVEEGVRQNHCVGRYCERVAVGESIILFLRRADDPSKNFFTMEIKKDMANLDVVQCRGYGNGEMTEEVKKFLAKYKRWFNHRSLDGYDTESVMVHYFKAVRKKDGKYISNYDQKTEFKIGEWKEAELDRDSDKVAVKGLHVASLEFAQHWGNSWDDVAILEVETNIHDVVVPDAKDQVRTSRFRVIREVPFDEMGEWGAKRLEQARKAAEKAA
jgi:hypothetical protein